MQAFRQAFKDRDSAKELDLRTEGEERVIAGRRSSPRNAVSEPILRQQLAEDLGSLLNTINLAASENLEGLEHVKASILNFGVADLTALSSEEDRVALINDWLSETLRQFEPRLVKESLNIIRESAFDETSGLIRFHVRGEMHSNPTNTHIEFVADVETNSGKLRVAQR